MDKIKLIILREYLSRVKKKSFIIMTLLGPLLMAGVVIVPVLLARVSQDEAKVIEVVDETGLYVNKLGGSESVKFVYSDKNIIAAKQDFDSANVDGILYIPSITVNYWQGIQLFTEKQPNISLVSYLEKTLQKEIESQRLQAEGIDEEVLKKIKTNVSVNSILLTDGGETKSSSELSAGVGFVGSFLIYFFIFLYGAQVMRGVVEEKTSRIVEVIISSVKPFQLMMGKIVGVAMVGLTQFLLWVVLTATIVTIAGKVLLNNEDVAPSTSPMMRGQAQMEDQAPQSEMADVFEMIGAINFPVILGVFIFYFIGGYLLYGSLFAAIGAAVDSETDTQQFMLPITIPLILSIIIAQMVITNPGGSLAFWFSIIPFTSPIIMMIRIPFGVPYGELALSAGLLIAGFLFTTWLAARIYRVGILMYGKKVSYKELGKWLFYKS